MKGERVLTRRKNNQEKEQERRKYWLHLITGRIVVSGASSNEEAC